MNRQPTPANILDNVLTADVAPDRTALRSRLRWDYAQVAPVDRKAVEDAAVDILANGQRAMESASAAGQRLIEAKRILSHGQFGDWIETEFGMTQRMAQMWMNIARTFDGKSEIISLFSETAVALLAAPSTPEPARQQAIAEAQATGKSPSVQRTKDIIAEHKPAPLTEEQIDEFLAYYWRGAQLQAIADKDDPRGVLRKILVRTRAGGSGGRWRYQTMSGKVECWDGGDYFARPADAVWTYDQFARLSLRVLPSPSWVQQPDDLGSADVEQRIRAEIDANAAAATVQIIEYDAAAQSLPTNGYASQSQIEDWLTEIPGTPAQLLEAEETLSGPIWNQLQHLAAGQGYELSVTTPKAALRNVASERAYAERKASKPDDRINRARILINHYAELCDACERALEREPEYEALVGTPSDLLAAQRGMHAIVDTLHEPIAKLQHLIETLIAAAEAA